jgi:protease-4
MFWYDLQVAQGRVWTGRQALQRGLVDHLGGLWTALQVADQLSRPNSTAPLQAPTSFRVQTLREPRSGFPSLSLLQSAIAVMLGKRAGQLTKVRPDEVQAVCAQAGLPGVVTGHQGALQGTIIQARQLWGNML